MSKLFLFTSTTCPKCPAAKNLIKVHNLDCDIIEVGTNPGAENKAMAAGVRSVPQFVEKEGAIFTRVDLDIEETFNRIKQQYGK